MSKADKTIHIRLDYEIPRKLQRERKAYAPRELPKTRPRALTFPQLHRSARTWQPFRRDVPQTLEQLQCPLYAQLPTEIRRIIWIEALGSRVLHIVRAKKRLLAIECAENFEGIGLDLETSHHGCWGLSGWPGKTGFYDSQRTNHPARPANLLPLLQTCRRIYQETIPILYETNIFDMNHVDTLAYLRRSVLPQRLDQIRKVNFTCCFRHWPSYPPPYDEGTWNVFCDSLARLASLEELTVHLKAPSRTWAYDWVSVGSVLDEWHARLHPLMQLRPAKRFEVFVPWPEDKCMQVDREAGFPFKLSPRVAMQPKHYLGDNIEL